MTHREDLGSQCVLERVAVTKPWGAFRASTLDLTNCQVHNRAGSTSVSFAIGRRIGDGRDCPCPPLGPGSIGGQRGVESDNPESEGLPCG
jgi:hypothetical protein